MVPNVGFAVNVVRNPHDGSQNAPHKDTNAGGIAKGLVGSLMEATGAAKQHIAVNDRPERQPAPVMRRNAHFDAEQAYRDAQKNTESWYR